MPSKHLFQTDYTEALGKRALQKMAMAIEKEDFRARSYQPLWSGHTDNPF
jgi:hypothetical protein